VTFERQMRAAGAVVLDGSRPTAELASRIDALAQGSVAED
jgi:hypothetical protein